MASSSSTSVDASPTNPDLSPLVSGSAAHAGHLTPGSLAGIVVGLLVVCLAIYPVYAWTTRKQRQRRKSTARGEHLTSSLAFSPSTTAYSKSTMAYSTSSAPQLKSSTGEKHPTGQPPSEETPSSASPLQARYPPSPPPHIEPPSTMPGDDAAGARHDGAAHVVGNVPVTSDGKRSSTGDGSSPTSRPLSDPWTYAIGGNAV